MFQFTANKKLATISLLGGLEQIERRVYTYLNGTVRKAIHKTPIPAPSIEYHVDVARFVVTAQSVNL